jgi:hypothetical protein
MKHRQPKTITLTINTENAAFDAHECGEIARILRTEARQIAAQRRARSPPAGLVAVAC